MSITWHQSPITVKRVSLIFVACLIGDGTTEDPERTAFFYYNDEGELMACHDPRKGEPDALLYPEISALT